MNERLVKVLAHITAEILQNWIVEGKRPKIVWEDQPKEPEWHEWQENQPRSKTGT